VCSVSRARTLSHLAKSPCLPPPCIDLVFILRHSFADSPPLQRRPLRALSPKPHLAAPPGRTTHTDTNIQRQWGAERELSKDILAGKSRKKSVGQLFMRDLRFFSNLPRERDGTLDSRSFRHDCFRDSFTERLGLYMFQNSLRVQCLIFIPHASLNVPELAFRMHTASDTEMHSHKCLAFGPPWFVGRWLSRVASNQTPVSDIPLISPWHS